MFVKKGDKVKVITGKDKNKEGVVLEAFPKKDRVIVEGVNVVKKFIIFIVVVVWICYCLGWGSDLPFVVLFLLLPSPS